MSAPWQKDMLLARLAFAVVIVAALYAADVLQRRTYAAYEDTLILFYADWCGHCKSFMPQWSRFTASASRMYPEMATLAVESSNGNAIGAVFNVASFPTLVYIDRNCRRHNYTGPRTSEGLLSFVAGLR